MKAHLSQIAVFVAVFCALQLGWQATSTTALHRWVVNDLTVGTSTLLVNALTPAVHAQSVGTAVHAPGGGLNIVNGCEGTEAWFLLAAALAVAHLSGRRKLTGLLLGTVVVFGVNQLRILALFYANRSNPELFNLLHAVVGPIAVIGVVAGFFYGWINRNASQSAAAA